MNKETEQRIIQAKQLSIEKSQSNSDQITVHNIEQDLAIVDQELKEREIITQQSKGILQNKDGASSNRGILKSETKKQET